MPQRHFARGVVREAERVRRRPPGIVQVGPLRRLYAEDRRPAAANPDLWKSTAVFVTVDEGGRLLRLGLHPAARLLWRRHAHPADRGFAVLQGRARSHGYADHVSILKFIERNWHLPTISDRSRDRLKNPVQNGSDPLRPGEPPGDRRPPGPLRLPRLSGHRERRRAAVSPIPACPVTVTSDRGRGERPRSGGDISRRLDGEAWLGVAPQVFSGPALEGPGTDLTSPRGTPEAGRRTGRDDPLGQPARGDRAYRRRARPRGRGGDRDRARARARPSATRATATAHHRSRLRGRPPRGGGSSAPASASASRTTPSSARRSTRGPRGARLTWVVDPIDGTANFVNGFPLFAASIGVLHEGRPVAGALWCSTSHALPGRRLPRAGRPVRSASRARRFGRAATPAVRRHLVGEPGTGEPGVAVGRAGDRLGRDRVRVRGRRPVAPPGSRARTSGTWAAAWRWSARQGFEARWPRPRRLAPARPLRAAGRRGGPAPLARPRSRSASPRRWTRSAGRTPSRRAAAPPPAPRSPRCCGGGRCRGRGG